MNTPRRPRYGQRKNTKRWCRGRVGVLHTPQIIKESWGNVELPCQPLTDEPGAQVGMKHCWHRVICGTCGKHLGEPENCPDKDSDEG